MPDLGQSETSAERIWTCKIGGPVPALPDGADYPMREAIELAYLKLTGREAQFNFSGWGGELTEPERAVVEDRLPRCPTCELIYNERTGDCPTCGA